MTNWIKIAIISHNNLAIKAFLICFIWFVRQWRTNKRKSEKKEIVIIIWNFSKYDLFSIHFNSCHFHHRIYHELTMACSPVGLISSVDRSLRPIIAKVRVPLGFPLKPEFFRFIFNAQVVHYTANHDHAHFHIFIHSSKYDSLHIFQFTITTTMNKAKKRDSIRRSFACQGSKYVRAPRNLKNILFNAFLMEFKKKTPKLVEA